METVWCEKDENLLKRENRVADVVVKKGADRNRSHASDDKEIAKWLIRR